jgi:hypothetical protein
MTDATTTSAAKDVELGWSNLRIQCLNQPDTAQLRDVEEWVRTCPAFYRSELPFSTRISGVRVLVTEKDARE